MSNSSTNKPLEIQQLKEKYATDGIYLSENTLNAQGVDNFCKTKPWYFANFKVPFAALPGLPPFARQKSQTYSK